MMSCILVVEDEIIVREVLVDTLTDAGFRTVEVGTAEAAIPLLENDDFGLIVTDINLPGRLDGIGLAQAARQRWPRIPVVFISGRPSKLAEARVLGDPAAFLAKPFSMAHLVAHVSFFVRA